MTGFLGFVVSDVIVALARLVGSVVSSLACLISFSIMSLRYELVSLGARAPIYFHPASSTFPWLLRTLEVQPFLILIAGGGEEKCGGSFSANIHIV